MLQILSYYMNRSWKIGVTVIGIYHTYQHQEDRQQQQFQTLINKIKYWKQPIVSLRYAHQIDIYSAEEKCLPFMVNVVQLMSSDPMKYISNGSGIIVDNQLGLIVTNNHVIQANDRLVVDLINNETLRYCDVFIGDENQEIIYRMFGRVVYTAPDHELALIQLLPIRSNVLPVCKFTTDCQPGDPIAVMSASEGQSFICDGLIQIIDKRQNLIKCYKNHYYINDLGDTTDVLIHTGFIVGGYSGGPVIDMSGQVVGVHKGSVRGYSYFSAAIGAKTVMDFIEKGKQYLLTENVEVMKGLARKHRRLMKRKILGLVLVNNQIVDYTFTSYLTRQHLLITDYIIAYNNIPFTTPEAMSYYVQQLPDNTPPIVVTVYRSNYNQYFTVNTQPITVEQFHC